MSRLKKFRELREVGPGRIAADLSIGIPAYFDLESEGPDLRNAISIRTLSQLCRSLEVSPSALFDDRSDIVATAQEFVARLASHIERTGQSAREFSAGVGWDVERVLADPGEVGNLNVDGFQAICEAMGLNWLSVLDQIKLSPRT